MTSPMAVSASTEPKSMSRGTMMLAGVGRRRVADGKGIALIPA